MPLFQSTIKTLPLIHRGKVRDLYAVGQDHLLIVTTDRLSAFDVVLPTPIPEKGVILTALSHFWFQKLNFANHLSGRTLEEVLPDLAERAEVLGRSTVARRFRALPIEAIVRGYLSGSGWKDYQKTGQVCGVPLPPGLREADRLPEPIFTPSTKAAVGDHDENISFQQTVDLIGKGLAHKLREAALSLYQEAAEYALARGILIADTKFEFGISEDGQLILIDEALTPDSSRFWPLDQYEPGRSPPSFDKQYVRDYLESCQWDKKPPAPELPTEVVARTTEKYREALHRLV